MLSWMLNRILTGNPQAVHRQIRALRDEIEAKNDELQQLRKAQEGICGRLDELESAHRKLRGRFYQARGVGELVSEPATREERRAQAFKQIGFTPGRPVNHTE